MSFTYSEQIKIGNWYNERILNKEKIREYNANVHNRSNPTLCMQQKIYHHISPVTQEKTSKDGTMVSEHLLFNTPYMFQNAGSNKFISIDIDDTCQVNDKQFVVATTASSYYNSLIDPTQVKAQNRNCFIITPVLNSSDKPMYGEKVYIHTIPSLGQYLCLASSLITHSNYCAASREQPVYFDSCAGKSAYWTVEFANPEYRLEMKGQYIQLNDPFIILHNMTNKPVATSINFQHNNDFGIEYEVYCKKHTILQSKQKQTVETAENMWFAHALE